MRGSRREEREQRGGFTLTSYCWTWFSHAATYTKALATQMQCTGVRITTAPTQCAASSKDRQQGPWRGEGRGERGEGRGERGEGRGERGEGRGERGEGRGERGEGRGERGEGRGEGRREIMEGRRKGLGLP